MNPSLTTHRPSTRVWEGRRRFLGWLGVLTLSGCCRDSTLTPSTAPKPSAPPWRGLLYVKQERPGSRRDLWVQSLDGLRHSALTDSGKVAAWNRPQVEGAVNGAVISPEGTRIAYAERHSVSSDGGSSLAPTQSWNVLFVVNADGTGRRKLVDLRDGSLTPGTTRAGSFIWSSDGQQLAYALETSGPSCALLSIHLVDIASSKVTALPLNQPMGAVQLLVWSTPRDEISFASQCGSEGEQRLGVLTISSGTVRTHPTWRPSVSPDGVRAFVPEQPLPGKKTGLVSMKEGFTPEYTLEAAPGGRLNWYHQQPGGLFTEVAPEPLRTECAGVTPPAQRLYRLDPLTRTVETLRQDATTFTVLDLSPDDTHVLVNILVGRYESMIGFCGDGWLQQLYLVRREDLESELPREQLIARSVTLESATPWPGPSNAPYIGWLR